MTMMTMMTSKAVSRSLVATRRKIGGTRHVANATAESVVGNNNHYYRRRQLFSSSSSSSSSTTISSRAITATTAAALSTSTTITTTNSYHHQYYDGRTSSQLLFTGLLGLTAAAAAATATASTQYDTDVSSSSSYLPISSTHGSTTAFMTLCEGGEANVDTATNANDDDPYENLPEHDEPTHCSICLTYRQGPCRPLWRKVEACTKDNEMPTTTNKENDERDADAADDDDDESSRPDPPCLKYMMPWIECASGYRNLYALIELDTNYTDGIEDLEQTASKHLCWMADNTPSVDWTPWQEYVNVLNSQWTLPPPSDQHELQPQPKQINVKKPWIADLVATARSSTKAEPSKPKKTPLWKLLDQSSDPEVVSIEAKVPSIRETIGSDGDAFGVMECAYAVDQDGQVLGFAYGVRPSDAVAGKIPEDKAKTASDDQDQDNSNDNKTTDTTSDDDESKSKGDDGGTTVTMTIRLLPNRTRHIVIAASYTQVSPSSTFDEGTENSDAGSSGSSSSSSNYETHVYKSKPMKLDEMAVQRKE